VAIKMNIALIAHNKKKELMVDFCIAYKSILQSHNLFATGTTGALIIEQVGLNIYCFSPGQLGGEEQLGARVALNEIDMVIFLRDPFITNELEPDVNPLLKLCDIHSIPFATNIATAEMLVKGLERGDLDWRKLVRESG
jgi:methylglyoxal synthase